VRYGDSKAVTANEIHIPAGVPVQVVGTTADVIHSFWIPELNRKVDLIPGSENRVLLEAEKPGFYRGQCSEFCGVQHAHMAVGVVAEPESAFRSWLASMARPARAPTATDAQAGLRVFLGAGCASCHRIAGTGAAGEVGPDLTHLAGRRTLAALTLPNTADALSAWIANPQAFKPGANMPASALSPQELRDLTAYLGSLR
jgi:cytochrome c oxidase subunit 2